MVDDVNAYFPCWDFRLFCVLVKNLSQLYDTTFTHRVRGFGRVKQVIDEPA